MRGTVLVTLMVLPGCDLVYGLHERSEIPRVFPTMGDVAPGTCWSASPMPGDEDGDMALDGCDNCPALPNAEQLDGDADGVGDLCDPNPGYAVDQIMFFANMSINSRLVDWTRRNGTWEFVPGPNGNDSFAQTGISPPDLIALALATPPPIRGLAIEIQSTLAQPTNGMTADYGLGVRVVTAELAEHPDGVGCDNTVQDGPDQLSVFRARGGAREGLRIESQAVGGQVPYNLQLATFVVEDNQLRPPRCRSFKGVPGGDVSIATTVGMTDAVEPVEGRAALRTFSSTVQFRSLVLYGSREDY